MVTKTYLEATIYNWLTSQTSARRKFSLDLYRLELAAPLGFGGDFSSFGVGMVFLVYVLY